MFSSSLEFQSCSFGEVYMGIIRNMLLNDMSVFDLAFLNRNSLLIFGRTALICSLLALVCLMLTGCELAGLDAAALGEIGEASSLEGVTALSRVAGADGAAISESESAALRSASASRTAAGALGIQGASPFIEEVAILRASARILSYPESYPLARNGNFTVTFPNGSSLATFARSDSNLVVSNGSNQIVGESVLEGNKIVHYTDSTKTVARGYTIIDGNTLKHWIYDRTGNPQYFCSEQVQIPLGTPPARIVIPAFILAAIQHQSTPSNSSQAQPQTSQRQLVHTPRGNYLPLGGYPVLTPDEEARSHEQTSQQSNQPISRHPLRHDGEILNVHVQARPTVVWSDGYVDVWADDGIRHYVLAPGESLKFPNSETIHAIPHSDSATELYSKPFLPNVGASSLGSLENSSENGRAPTSSNISTAESSPLRHTGQMLNLHVQGRPTVVWSDGYVDVWADNGTRHYVLAPGERLNFPGSNTIHALPRSDDAMTLYHEPSVR
jgi:hypothetical protein